MKKQGRPASNAPALTRERILEAALALVDAGGVERLTMRGLARGLGVDPMAIYHYLPGKAAILHALVDSVMGRAQPALAPDADWREHVRAVAHAHWSLARAHPSLLRWLALDPSAWTPAALRLTEALLQAFHHAGLPLARSLLAADVIADYVNGCALAERSASGSDAETRRALLERLTGETDEPLPLLRAALAESAGDAIAPNFDAGLEVIIAGIAASEGLGSAPVSP